MFESNKTYTNRYNDDYKWVTENESTYRFEITGDSMKYSRFAGRKGQDELSFDDLGMFDPSGGPYVALGMEIDGKPITRLYHDKDNMYAQCL